MIAEMVNYCIAQLRHRPKRLVVHKLLNYSQYNTFNRLWAKYTFETQQQAIVRLHPDHPDYGRGYLWNYVLIWSNPQEDKWSLRIEYSDIPEPSARALILWASTTPEHIPFPFSKEIFTATKARMLDKERGRPKGAILPSLRPAVATVQFDIEDGRNCIYAWDISESMSLEF